MPHNRKHTRVRASVSEDHEAFGCIFERTAAFWPSGVAILALPAAEGPAARMTVSTVTTVSLDPPIVSVCLHRDATMTGRMAQGTACALHLLEQGAAAFAKTPATATLDVEPGGALASLDGRVRSTVPAGDHVIVLIDVHAAASRPGRPLVYWRRAFWQLDVRHPFMASAETLDTFIADWHAGRLKPADWTHGAHVAACAYHAFGRDADETFALMKRGILDFAAANGIAHTPTSGYHETLTRLWSLVIVAHLAEHPAASPWDAAASALERFGDDRDLHRLFYPYDILGDARSRAEWIPPQMTPTGGATDDAGWLDFVRATDSTDTRRGEHPKLQAPVAGCEAAGAAG